MHKTSLLELLAEVQRGNVSPESASERLASLPFENIGHTRIDHHRSLRTGLPEVIYAAGKTPRQVAEIFARMVANGAAVLATRANADHAAAVLQVAPAAKYDELARTISLPSSEPAATNEAGTPCIAVLDRKAHV